MMIKEPKAMKEIHQIKRAICEKEKDLSARERIEKLHKEVAEITEKSSLKLKIRSKT